MAKKTTDSRDADQVPSEISVGVYYYIDDDGTMVFDEEEMQREFEQKLKKLKGE